jgi:hypothetical protein
MELVWRLLARLKKFESSHISQLAMWSSRLACSHGRTKDQAQPTHRYRSNLTCELQPHTCPAAPRASLPHFSQGWAKLGALDTGVRLGPANLGLVRLFPIHLDWMGLEKFLKNFDLFGIQTHPIPLNPHGLRANRTSPYI